MGEMSPLRFILILFLTVALDLSAPLPPHASESIEEFEEVLHGRQERRTFRLIRDMVAASIAQETRRLDLQPDRPLPRGPFRPAIPVALARKAPSPLAEPSTAPEDH
jgi:hypothetical protein